MHGANMPPGIKRRMAFAVATTSIEGQLADRRIKRSSIARHQAAATRASLPAAAVDRERRRLDGGKKLSFGPARPENLHR